MANRADIPRRTFLKTGVAVGGGLLVGVRLPAPGGEVEADGMATVQNGSDSQQATLHAFV